MFEVIFREMGPPPSVCGQNKLGEVFSPKPFATVKLTTTTTTTTAAATETTTTRRKVYNDCFAACLFELVLKTAQGVVCSSEDMIDLSHIQLVFFHLFTFRVKMHLSVF